jgi:hypothetical protein
MIFLIVLSIVSVAALAYVWHMIHDIRSSNKAIQDAKR